jgi:hypothetical protein
LSDGAAKEQAKQLVNASEWRLTWWTCMSWGREKQNAVSKYPVERYQIGASLPSETAGKEAHGAFN